MNSSQEMVYFFSIFEKILKFDLSCASLNRARASQNYLKFRARSFSGRLGACGRRFCPSSGPTSTARSPRNRLVPAKSS